MSLALRLVSQIARRPGGATPTGDQGASNALALGGDGLAADPRIGVTYVPVLDGAASLGTSSIAWRGASDSNDAIGPNRVLCWGPFKVPANATLKSFRVYGRGGTNAGAIRMALYTDSGETTDSTNLVDTSVPVNWLAGAVTAEATISAGQAEGWITLTFPGGITNPSDQFLWFALWTSNWTTPGPEFLTNNGTNFCRRARTTAGGASAYSSSGDPRATMPIAADMTIANRRLLQAHLVYELAAPGTIATVTAAAISGVRGATVVWTAAADADRYLVERSVGGGAYTTVGATAELSLPDPDCPAGSVAYRVTSIRESTDGTPTVSNTVTVGGVRVAHATAAPTILGSTTRITPRPLAALYGANAVPTFTRLEWYRRYNHADFEPTLGAYTIATIKDDLDDLNGGAGLATGQRYAFRIRWTDDNNFSLPSDTPSDRYGGTSPQVWPNWATDADYWTHPTTGRIALMLNAISVLEIRTGVQLKDDPRLAWVEFGWGKYGENANVVSGSEVPTPTTWENILAAFATAFPNHYFVIPVFNPRNADAEAQAYTSYTHPQVIGTRADSFGDGNASTVLETIGGVGMSPRLYAILRDPTFWKIGEPFGPPLDTTRWRRHDIEAEAIGLGAMSDVNYSDYGSLATAAQDAIDNGITQNGHRFEVTALHYPKPIRQGNAGMYIRAAIRNTGRSIYPPQETRYLQVQLRQAGVVYWSLTLDGLALNDLLPGGPATLTGKAASITGLAPGDYDVCVQIPGDGAALSPVALAIDGVETGTYYVIDTVTVS